MSNGAFISTARGTKVLLKIQVHKLKAKFYPVTG